MFKRILKFLISFLIICLIAYLVNNFYKSRLKEVKYLYTLDGDSFVLEIEEKEVEIRLLAINTPELKDEFGIKARDLTKEILENGKEIIIEKDLSGDEYDRYNRLLVWVFVDGELLQEKLVASGLAKVAYLFNNNYTYLDQLNNAQEKAKNDKLGIWSIENP